MTQTSNRIFDEMARLMGDAASVAQGVKREAETAFRSQIERFVAEMDLVKREEFDVVREMATKARSENEALKRRIEELEARLGDKPKAAPRKVAAAKTASAKSASAKTSSAKAKSATTKRASAKRAGSTAKKTD